MKKAIYLLALLLAFSSAAFAVDKKTVAGAVVGGVAGAVIGNEVGGEKGAAIGAVIGGVTGATIASDKPSSRVAQPLKPAAVAAPVQPQPVVMQAQSEHDQKFEDGGKSKRHRDNGNHYGQRKHQHGKNK